MISRDEAVALLRDRNPTASQWAHAVESEAVLAALARRVGADEALWGMTGLLHDLDFDVTRGEPAKHGVLAGEWLAGSLPEEALVAIAAHNFEENGAPPPAEPLDFALRCGETVTGLISATALIRPQGMSGLGAKSLKKKMKDKRFAANVRREVIRECERLDLELAAFLDLAADAIAPLADELGLNRTG